MEHELRQCLKSTWGHEKFRPYQLEVIQASLSGRDAFVLMSTGSGKSVCYQLPAVMRRKGMPVGPVTVVVSPLISLMEDQVLSLSNNGIASCHVGGSADLKNDSKAMAGEFALVFVTPEKLSGWTHALRAMEDGPGLAMFAVDESHCVSEWGHDFRPSYLELRTLRDTFPKVPIMALTATATPRVEQEIMSNLGLRNPFIAKTSFNRPNLHYSVKIISGQSKSQEISTLLRGLDGSAIIYVMTKNDAETLAAYVADVVGAKGAKAYHGGMASNQRRAVHRAFIRDEIQVVVATLAFGMGIDKPDVRLVIHSGMPKTVESYYQQTGRAGRDGLPAKCVLLFSRADAVRQKAIMSMSTNGIPPSPEVLERDYKLLAAMEKFATAPTCRRRALLGYFGEHLGDSKCEGCDACDCSSSAAAASANGVKSNEDVELFTEPARLVLQAVMDSGGRFGFSVPISLLLGTKKGVDRVPHAKMKPSFGKGKDQRGLGEPFWKALFHQLVEREGFLEGVSFTTNGGWKGSRMGSGLTYGLTPAGKKFLANPQAKLPASFVPSDELAVEGRRVKASRGHTQAKQSQSGPGMELSDDEKRVYDLMYNLRSEIASRLGLPPYNVLGAQVLRQLAVRRPTDLTTLATVDGMSEKKVADFGAEIIAVVAKACQEGKLDGNVPAASPQNEAAWLKPLGGAKPLTNAQILFHEDYLKRGNMTLAEVAAARPLSIGTASGYLAACLEGGKVFPWDRRRLGIDPDLENEVVNILENIKTERRNSLQGIFLRKVFEALPPGTDKGAYNVISLVLARMRFEGAGGRLPGSRGDVLARKPSTTETADRKRALPSWEGGLAKKPFPEVKATSIATRLFTPSYTSSIGTMDISSQESSPSPPDGRLVTPRLFTLACMGSSGPTQNSSPSRMTPATPSTSTRNVVQAMETSPEFKAGASGLGLFTPSYVFPSSSTGTEKAGDAVAEANTPSSEPWTSDKVLRIINESGGSGVSFKVMAAANPGNDAELERLLARLQEDVELYTKPAKQSGGETLYFAL